MEPSHAESANQTTDRRATNNEFIKDVIRDVPGMMNDFTGACLMELLDFQSEHSLVGSALEIGVFGGRFCSILARDAIRRGSNVLAIDPFSLHSREIVQQSIAKICNMNPSEKPGQLIRGNAKIELVSDISGNWNSHDLLFALGSRARFIHIDGSHLRADVLWDLAICDQVLASHGIIAVDDWLNPQCFGVNEAIFQFFQSPPRSCVPMAYVTGKLLLSGRTFAQTYQNQLLSFVNSDRVYGQSSRYRQRVVNKASWIRQTLLGSEMIVLF